MQEENGSEEDRQLGFSFSKEQTEIADQPGEERHTPTDDFKLLGYEFVPTYEKGSKGKHQLVVSESGWKELKEKIRTITRKTAPLALAERTRQMKEIGRGWVNYFRLASLVGKLGTIDSWVRNPLLAIPRVIGCPFLSLLLVRVIRYDCWFRNCHEVNRDK